ncbi:type II toxin-antitoxin system VapC family toxin [Propylenella binzhouense]|uniref:Type II toxin-antitoxin system VapC family toxin n=1 Tax=Propylenella binzhouense TaxID=2555902 RepID=A0A964T663_9HYPH|nr:type II toxin-antitoxin system VapC family toxin [Propylenella binzhouense]MYZ48132.1 type II toxin-antitoxin system VapC family toxin [Propylenella binzhouense]
MSTLVDSNVLIDVIEMAEVWSEWSAARLAEAADLGEIIINPIVLAETSMHFLDEDAYEAAAFARLTREQTPWEAAFRAGQAHARYRRSGGMRERTLPDFLIGAHAAVKGHRLLTRDARRYRAYFPDLDIIAPDTHP